MTPFKSASLNAALWAVAFLAPLQSTLLAAVFLLLIDLVFGVWASLKSGEKFSSAKFSRSVTKVVAYNLAIITAYVVETNLLPMVPLTKGAAGLVGSTEIVSVFESVARITGLPVSDFLKKLFNRESNKDDSNKPAA
jgi:phage-related holin